MKKLVLFSLIFVGLSCISEHVPTQFDKYDLAKPIITNNDTTVVLVNDYYPLVEKINYFDIKGYELLSTKEFDYDTVSIVKGDQTPKLSHITITYKGESAIIPVLNYDPQNIRDNSYLYSVGYDKKSISLQSDTAIKDIMVLWQNSLIDKDNYSVENSNGITSIKIMIPNCAKDYQRSYIRVYASNDTTVLNDILIPLYHGKVMDSAKELNRKDKHAQILYSLLIDRFVDGNLANTVKLNRKDVLPKVDYYGGDLEGVLSKIESGFFDELGINTIWLSPITQNPWDAWGLNLDPKTKFSGYHGYWPIFITKIDTRFGSDSVLRRLLKEAHLRDINVILDYVSNHMHINSPTLKAHPDWVTPQFTKDGRPNIALWDEYRLTTWFDTHIPSLDLEKSYVYEPMTDSALLWMQRFDFDGFRHDATKHIPEIFWRTLTKKLLKSLPNRSLYQIGETYGNSNLIGSYVKNGMLDAQFDFNVYDSAIWSMINKDGSFEDLSKVLNVSLNSYGYHNLMGNITGNHDRPRFISLAGGAVKPDEDYKMAGWKREIGVGDTTAYNKLLLLHVFNFTIPGVPCIYYGDEYGEPGANDPDNRRWMRFDNYNSAESLLLQTVKNLTELRKNNLSLIYGDYKELYASKDLLIYSRTYMGESIVVALNKSDRAQSNETSLGERVSKGSAELIQGRGCSLNGDRLQLMIDPYSYTIVKIK